MNTDSLSSTVRLHTLRDFLFFAEVKVEFEVDFAGHVPWSCRHKQIDLGKEHLCSIRCKFHCLSEGT